MMGQLLAYAGLLEGREVVWIPSYGAEMRGGTANCAVSISDSFINDPLVSEPDILLVMNEPSLVRFEAAVKPGGYLFLNSSLISHSPKRVDLKIFCVPASDCADGLGDPRVANIVMLGALLRAQPLVKVESVLAVLEKTLSGAKRQLLPLNSEALSMGARLVAAEL